MSFDFHTMLPMLNFSEANYAAMLFISFKIVLDKYLTLKQNSKIDQKILDPN